MAYLEDEGLGHFRLEAWAGDLEMEEPSGPALKFQIALTSNALDDTLVWTDIPGSNAVSYNRGEPNEYGQMETGESSVQVGDPTSALDPNNTASPYYPNVKRGKAMRAVITLDGVEYPLFQHTIERLPRAVSVGSVWTERAITGVDGFAGFALAGLKGRSYAAETSGARWGHVLDDVNWPAGRRNIDAGSSSLDAIAFADNDSTKALQHLLDVTQSENGFGFINAAGQARFVERHASIVDTTVSATFADGRSIATGSYPGAIPYVDLTPESTAVVNDYSGQRDGGAVMTASDAASILEQGPRSKELKFLLSSDAVVQDALNWLLSQTKDPAERIDGLTVMPGTDTTLWAAVLGLEVGDRVRVVEWAPGFTAPVETEFLIRHLAASIPLPVTAASFTFQMTPAADVNVWIAEDAVRGLAGVTTRAGY